MFRLLRILLIVALLATLAPATLAQAQTAATDPRYFSETGYRVDNDAFWSFFQHRGGVRTFGYPVSREFRLDGFPVQIFQRVIMQRNPDGSVATLNLLDQGLMPYTRINGSTFPSPDPAITAATPSPSDPAYADKIIDFVERMAPDTFEGEPVNFATTFKTTVRYEDAFPNGEGPASLLPLMNLELWGAPTSRPMRDPSNDNFIYQRFQRGIMHYDKTCGCTQGLLLADYLKSLLTGENLPPDLEAQASGSPYYKQYAPGQPRSVARASQLPGTDLTDAFVQQQPRPGQVPATPTQPSPSPVPSPAAGPTVAAPPGEGFAYGFQVHMWDFGPQGKTDVVNLVKGAGFNWIKHQVEWQTVEQEPGVFAWGELDAIVDTASRANLGILLSVVHAPRFYRDRDSGLMPGDNSTFQRFMQELATRYRGRVQAYEIWNEQNLDRETGTGNVNPANYLELLKAGTTGVRAADPNALVLLGATSPTGANIPGVVMDDLLYLEQLYALNGGEVSQYFDALGAHPSGFSNPPDCTPSTPECSLSGGWNDHPSFFAFHRVGQYRDVMLRYGDGDKKIWFTEFGYGSTDRPVAGYEYAGSISQQQQGEFLVRAFQKAHELGYVGGMIVWNLNYQLAVPKADEKWSFGVINGDWTPRPAYVMLANMPKPA